MALSLATVPRTSSRGSSRSSRGTAVVEIPQPPTAIRMLCEDLQGTAPDAQLSTLLVLEVNWSFIRRAHLRLGDAKHLLAILFQILTMQQGQHHATADAALRLLHHLVGQSNNPHFAVFTNAMRAILEDLGLTDEMLYTRPPPPPKEATLQAVVEATGQWTALESERRAKLQEYEKAGRMRLHLMLKTEPEMLDPTLMTSESPKAIAIAMRDGEIVKSLYNDIVQRMQSYIDEACKAWPRSWPPETEVSYGLTSVTPKTFQLDAALEEKHWRQACVDILRTLDLAGINTQFLLSSEKAHLYIPHRFSGKAKVFRDFVQCTPTPRYAGLLGAGKTIHVKTNIPAKSDIMYRFHVEGYNYGNNSIINCDIVGYTHNRWDVLGQSEQYGWPEGWDKDSINHYAPGAELSQYYSTDHFMTLRLQAPSFFSVGFTVSAWLVCHSYGAEFCIAATVHHQEDDL